MRRPRVKKKIWPETQILLSIPVFIFFGLLGMAIYRGWQHSFRTYKPNEGKSSEAVSRILKMHPEAKLSSPAAIAGSLGNWIAFEARTEAAKQPSTPDALEISAVEGSDNLLHLAKFNDKTYYLLLSGNSPKDVTFQSGEFIKWLLEEAGLPKATARSSVPLTQ